MTCNNPPCCGPSSPACGGAQETIKLATTDYFFKGSFYPKYRYVSGPNCGYIIYSGPHWIPETTPVGAAVLLPHCSQNLFGRHTPFHFSPDPQIVSPFSSAFPMFWDSTLSFVAGDGDVDNASFTLSADDFVPGHRVWKIHSAIAFDYETKQEYTVRIRLVGEGFDTVQIITFKISDVWEGPTGITIQDPPLSVSENSPIGTTVGTFVVETGQYSNGPPFTAVFQEGFNDTNNSWFSIEPVGDPATTTTFTIKTAEVLDREKPSAIDPLDHRRDEGSETTPRTCRIRLFVADRLNQGIPSGPITISIADVVEPPDSLTISSHLTAQSKRGDVVGEFFWTTPDRHYKKLGDTVTLVSGVGDTNNNMFFIDNNYLRASRDLTADDRPLLSIRCRITTVPNSLTYETPLILRVY